MYYELEVYGNKLDTSDDALSVAGGWGRAVASAIKAVRNFFDEGKFSIMLGKDVLTSVAVDTAAAGGISLTVKGHLYKPDAEYNNAALLFRWFQEQEDYNATETQRAEIKKKMKNVEAEMTATNKGTGKYAKKAADKAEGDGRVGFRDVVLRVITDAGVVFRIYHLSKAYLASYAETYTMESGTGEFEMQIVHSINETEHAEILGALADNDLLTRLGRGVSKMQRHVNGAAAAIKTTAAITGTIVGGTLAAKSHGKKTEAGKIVDQIVKGMENTAGMTTSFGAGAAALGGMAKGETMKDSLNAAKASNEAFTQSNTKLNEESILVEQTEEKAKIDARKAAADAAAAEKDKKARMDRIKEERRVKLESKPNVGIEEKKVPVDADKNKKLKTDEK